ncbi:unnamed protein product, partial [Closterium sp. NIES-54]
FGDEVERPRWEELLRSRVAIFDLDFGAILTAMYALSVSAEGDCYWCMPPDPGIAAAALGASEYALPGTAPAEALHTFSVDSGASRCFFRDRTTLTPLPAPVPVRPADPFGGPVVARSSTVLPCLPILSSSFTPLLVSPPIARNSSLAQPPWSPLPATPAWPALPPSPAPPCFPCVEGRQRAAPHSSFPPTSAPLQTLHMDVWGPARLSRQGRERYFLLVVDDYTRYNTVFPLHSKGEVVDVLIPWNRAVGLQLREWFRADLPVLRLHSDRGGEFSSDLLRDICRGEGITHSFTLPASPQQNGIAERRIGLVMEVARTSMIHAAAPHFLWPFAVRYAAHQLNLCPHVSLQKTSLTLRWTGEVGDASVFRDVTFDESVPFYGLFPYRSAPPPQPPLFLASGPPPVDPLPAVVITTRMSGVAIFDLDFDVILSAMYALSASAEGECYQCVPPDPGIVAAALGASESGTLPGTAPAQALHTFTLDSGASRSFFRDSNTLTPLLALVSVKLADPSWGPVFARSSTILPCPAVPSGSLSGLHLPSFSTNLVSTAALQDAMVTTTTPGGQRVSICTCKWTGHHLATFTRRPGSSLYTLATEPPQVAVSSQVSESGQVAASCSCRLLSHQTLLWHHRLGHPSLPRLRGMHSRLLVSGLPRSLPRLPPSPALPCLPCVEGWQRAAPHSSSFPPTTAPLQTLHMDVKGEFVDVLIPWIRIVRLQLHERFGQNLPVLRLHSDRGVMEVARTSMIHAAAPHFLWPFAVRYAAHKLNLWLRVSLPETSPTLRRMMQVGDASVFRVWGSRAFVRDTSADNLSARAIPCIFLGFSPDAPGWQFYHPTLCHVLSSQNVTFDESVPFYHLFPYRSTPPPPPPLFLAPCPPGAESGGAVPGGAESEGARSVGAEPGGVEPGGAEPAGVELEGVESGGDEPRGAASSGGAAGASPSLSLRSETLSPQQLREWLVWHARLWSGAPGAGDTGCT